MELTQEQTVRLGMRVSPRLVAASYILELSSQELQQAIAQEIEENPAMELVEQASCQVCGGPLHGSICPNCLSQQKTQPTDGEYDDSDDYWHDRSLAAPLDDDFDPMTQVASQMTLSERLLNDLRATVPHDDYPIAQYLVGSLNDNGYLQTSIEEVAYELSVSSERVEAVLAALHTLDPIGIGARNLRECLLIQLDFLEEEHAEVPPLARQIVEDHLTALAEHKYSRIAHALGATTEQIAEAGRFIRDRLNPFPARGGSSTDFGDGGAQSNHIMPDVIINRHDLPNGGEAYDVDVVESKRFYLRVAPLYQRLTAELDRDPHRYSDDDRRHVKQYVSRAKLFIANINQRRQTMQKITEYIVEVQANFLRDGIRMLKPLTRAAVAAHLGMHESTVSRATAGKYVMLPNRKVIPFSDFFTASLSVMDVIKELIANEDVPKTDQEIADELGKRGITLARRTVAKYREQLNILPSSLR